MTASGADLLGERPVTGRIFRVADYGQRVIEGVIAPWNTLTKVFRPVAGWEQFTPGAFDESLADTRKRIPLVLGGHDGMHNMDAPAGVLVDHSSGRDGQRAVFKVLRTAAGNDALELVHEGLYLGLSVGGSAVPEATTIQVEPGTRRTIVTRSKMKLDHVALCRDPAYPEARVVTSGERHLQAVDSAAVTRARARQRRMRRQLERIDSNLAYLRALDAS